MFFKKCLQNISPNAFQKNVKQKTFKSNAFKTNAFKNNALKSAFKTNASKKVLSKNAFKNANVIIDFTVPKSTLEVLKIALKLKKRVVIGTTGFSKKEEELIKKYSRKIPILKAGNMSLGVNLLVYLPNLHIFLL